MNVRLEIEKIYIAYFNRPADNGGLTYWQGEISSGRATLADITAAFATTPEYLALYGGKSPDDVVTAIYQNLFGRAPEPEGLQYWSEGLRSGEFGIGTMAYTTLESAQLSDKTIIENKAGAALEFTEALNDLGGDAHYNGAAIDTARAWLAKIDATPQSVTAANAEITTVVKGFDGSQPEPEPEPTGPARVFTFVLGEGAAPLKPHPGPDVPVETVYPPHEIDNFVLGHDKIEIVDISGNRIDIAAPTWHYVHGPHYGGPGLEYQFSIYGALGFAHNGGKTYSLAALKAGETVLITYADTSGKSKTMLFVDDGLNPGTGMGGDNGPGSATWYLDSDLTISFSNLVGLKTTADDLHVVGSFFA